jgi:hypothetical protein
MSTDSSALPTRPEPVTARPVTMPPLVLSGIAIEVIDEYVFVVHVVPPPEVV